METFSALLDLCAENSLVTGEFPSQSPVTRSFDVFFNLHLDKQFSKHPLRQWFETPSRSLWRHRNANTGADLSCYMVPLEHDALNTWKKYMYIGFVYGLATKLRSLTALTRISPFFPEHKLNEPRFEIEPYLRRKCLDVLTKIMLLSSLCL